jgi:acyl carrier protein phosphodiesterase
MIYVVNQLISPSNTISIKIRLSFKMKVQPNQFIKSLTMNYLAHIFLSNHHPQIQIGNFIGDFVKGSHHNQYPAEIQKGILLHRQIDTFTDSHPVVRECIGRMRDTFGRYSGIVLDLYFDHLLALNFSDYSSQKSLRRFSVRFYVHLIIYYRYLPKRVKGFVWHFILTNRLEKYKTTEGLKNSLQIMELHKTPHISPEKAINYLEQNIEYFQHQFRKFFPELISFTAQQY